MTAARAQLGIFRVFLAAGATTFGGMWAATDKLERELVERTGWMSKEELRTSFVLATLIPSPRFLGLGGLVGFASGAGSEPSWGRSASSCPRRCWSSPAPRS